MPQNKKVENSQDTPMFKAREKLAEHMAEYLNIDESEKIDFIDYAINKMGMMVDLQANFDLYQYEKDNNNI